MLAAGSAVAMTGEVSSGGEEPSSAIPRREVDVAIVGAGLAGLTAATELRKQGVTVLVLEARDRVGGRTLDQPIGGGHVVEGGGQWVGPGQTHVLALAKDLGIDTFPSYTQGKTTLALAGLRFTAGAERASKERQRVNGLLEKMAETVPLRTPWTAAHAKEWDAVTLADWLRQTTTDKEVRQAFDLETEISLGAPKRLSLLYYLFYVHSAGGINALDVDAQERRFRGGSQSISKKLADRLGQDLVLASPVSRIARIDEGRVTVEAKRVHVSAKCVVVAMMPADTRRIEFAPALPAARRSLVKQWRGEPAFKVNVVYDKPFWRAAGLSGVGVADKGPVGVTFDNSPPDGSRGVLLSFLASEQIPKDAAKRRAAIVEGLVRLFGKEAGQPIGYHETDWSTDPWCTGCVSPLPAGVLTRYGSALREPVGGVHWAGTETSEVWCGYMEGAVRSGQRVAAEVRKVL